ncbi:Midasin [Trichinella britovi]|uniref:Midasin n=1 Tax=Trichinella britovi TaxID=45882 RepID=A0A0V1C9N7_TRIBR|nr:Midasin [Trichinella britovi]
MMMASLLQVALLFWLYKAQLTNCDYQAKCKRFKCQNVAKYLGPTTCKKHHDCPGQSICINEKCIVAQPTETECDTDLQCLRNEACKQGICWKEYKGMHRRVIIYPDIKKCTKHTECKNQSLCVYGKCKQAYPTDRRCQNDRECHRSEGCMHGICWRVDNVESTCRTHKTCPDQHICHDGFCRLGSPTNRVCNSDKNCKYDEGCKHGICWDVVAVGERCYKDAECGKLELCVSDYCRIAIPTHRDCASSNQCRREEKCRFDMCWKLYNKGEDILEKYCKRHAECKDQFICYRGKCQIAAPTNQNCESDNNCPPKQVCKHGICWTLAHDNFKKKIMFQKFPTINLRRWTYSILAIATIAYERSCDASAVQLNSNSNTNAKPPPQIYCISHDSCSNFTICYRRQCVPAVPTQSRCKHAKNCEAEQRCHFGRCWKERENIVSKPVEAKQIVLKSKTVLKCAHCTSPTATPVKEKQRSVDRVKVTTRSSKAKNVIEEIAEPILDLFNDDNKAEENKTTKNSTKLIPSKRCSYHTECGVVEMCVNKKCHSATPTKQRCQSAQQCPSRLCRYGRCWQPDSPNVQVVDRKKRKTSFCKVSKQCTSQQICLNGICTVAYPGTLRCTSDRQCRKNQICRYGRCWTANMQEALQEYNKKPVKVEPESPSAPEITNPEEGNAEEEEAPPEEGNGEEEEAPPEEGNGEEEEEEAPPEEENAEEPAEEEQPEEDAEEEETETIAQAAEEKRVKEPVEEPELAEETEPAEKSVYAYEPESAELKPAKKSKSELLENAKNKQNGEIVEETNSEMQVEDVLLHPPVTSDLDEDQHDDVKREESQTEQSNNIKSNSTAEGAENAEPKDGKKEESEISVNEEEKSESAEKSDDDAYENMSSENDTNQKSSGEVSKEEKEEEVNKKIDDDDKESVNENDNTEDEEVANDESDKNSKDKKNVKKDPKQKDKTKENVSN